MGEPSAIHPKIGPTHPLRVEGIWGNFKTIEGLSSEWLKLCEEGPCNEPFYRPEWIAAAIRAFAHSRKVLLITVREGTRLRAVLPLWEEKDRFLGFPFTKLHSATNPNHSCRFDIVHGDVTDTDLIVKAIWEYLRELSTWDAIELTNIPEGAAAEILVSLAQHEKYYTAQYEHVRTPYMFLDGFKPNSDVIQFVRSQQLRYSLRRSWRKLNKRGPVRLRRVERADLEELERFYCLEQAGWKGRTGTAIACSTQTRQFYDLVAMSAAGFGYFSLYFLELSDSVIAAHFGFNLAGNYYPTKVAYDENYREYSPGHLIVSAVLQDLVPRGVSKYDFLGHHEEWKARWTSVTQRHSFCYIFRDSLAGRALYAEKVLRQSLRECAQKFGRPILAFILSLEARSKARLGKFRSLRPARPVKPETPGR
jgi:CelD/BcsL family acetyltransferase involved in cellulose biosynthesis